MGKTKKKSKNKKKLRENPESNESETAAHTSREASEFQRDGNTFTRDIGRSTDDIQATGHSRQPVTKEKKDDCSSTSGIQAAEQSSLNPGTDLMDEETKSHVDMMIECMKAEKCVIAITYFNKEDFISSANQVARKAVLVNRRLNKHLEGRSNEYAEYVSNYINYQSQLIYSQVDFSVVDYHKFLAKTIAYDKILKSNEEVYEREQVAMKTTVLESGPSKVSLDMKTGVRKKKMDDCNKSASNFQKATHSAHYFEGMKEKKAGEDSNRCTKDIQIKGDFQQIMTEEIKNKNISTEDNQIEEQHLKSIEIGFGDETIPNIVGETTECMYEEKFLNEMMHSKFMGKYMSPAERKSKLLSFAKRTFGFYTLLKNTDNFVAKHKEKCANVRTEKKEDDASMDIDEKMFDIEEKSKNNSPLKHSGKTENVSCSKNETQLAFQRDLKGFLESQVSNLDKYENKLRHEEQYLKIMKEKRETVSREEPASKDRIDDYTKVVDEANDLLEEIAKIETLRKEEDKSVDDVQEAAHFPGSKSETKDGAKDEIRSSVSIPMHGHFEGNKDAKVIDKYNSDTEVEDSLVSKKLDFDRDAMKLASDTEECLIKEKGFLEKMPTKIMAKMSPEKTMTMSSESFRQDLKGRNSKKDDSKLERKKKKTEN